MYRLNNEAKVPIYILDWIIRKGGMDMLGEQSFQPYAINTFSHRGKNFEEITPIHYVRPHEVRQYSRRDGTLVSGYWRDGDGDTTINRQTGYYSRNPNAVSQIIRIGGKIL